MEEFFSEPDSVLARTIIGRSEWNFTLAARTWQKRKTHPGVERN